MLIYILEGPGQRRICSVKVCAQVESACGIPD